MEEKIEKLYLADLVYRSAARFCTFNDICLMRFIKFVYARSKMGMAQVEKLEQAGLALKQEARDAGRAVPEIQMWLASTGGFNREVLDHVKGREDAHFSNHDGINGIFQAYGGNYAIPVFHDS